MPELPEVQTICQELKQVILRKKIRRVNVYRKASIGYPQADGFIKALLGKEIKDIQRRGKYILFKLSQNKLLVFHLRLSGQLRYFKELPQEIYKSERIRFIFSTGDALSFYEPRALGKAYLISGNSYPQELLGLKNLGPDPLEAIFTYKYLYNKIHNRRAKIKSLLLDQRICAGVGNIYSDEALFLARIHPFTLAYKLSEHEIKRLVWALKKVLRQAIKTKGSSVKDYLRPNGSLGSYHLHAYVYGREGLSCRRCRTKISILKFGNRRTRFCPRCQVLK
ncbi:MAG: DNA-formamidopyrimidine glycosylase [candidate division WOR-3 bacterium]|nr:DNA-formamidopyrimidine glycosylase [candidate division WOR-3 bacterium]